MPKEKHWCKTAIVGFVFAIAWPLIFPLGFVLSRFSAIFASVFMLLLLPGLPIAGIVLSIIALIKIKHKPNLKGREFAWVGLIISVAIVLYLFMYFGRPLEKDVPPPCLVPSGIGCVDYEVTSNLFRFTLRNNLGSDLEYFVVSMSGDAVAAAPLASDWHVDSEYGGFTVIADESMNTINITSQQGALFRNGEEILNVTGVRSASGSWEGITLTNFELFWRKAMETLTHEGDGEIRVRAKE